MILSNKPQSLRSITGGEPRRLLNTIHKLLQVLDIRGLFLAEKLLRDAVLQSFLRPPLLGVGAVLGGAFALLWFCRHAE